MTWKRFYFSNPPFSHFLTNATKSQRLPQPLETQNKSSNLLFFAFLVILFPKNLVFPASPPLKGTWNETTDATGRRKKKCRKRERQKGEETRTSLQLLEPQINLIQGYMTTNINITQTWWRLLSAVGSTLITLVAWLGYMALCMVGEVILGIVKFIFGIIISILSMVVLIGTFIWLLTL